MFVTIACRQGKAIYSQLCLSRICWDWRNSFDLEKIQLMSRTRPYKGLKTIEYKDKRTWIDLRLWRLFNLCKFDLSRVDCMCYLTKQNIGPARLWTSLQFACVILPLWQSTCFFPSVLPRLAHQAAPCVNYLTYSRIMLWKVMEISAELTVPIFWVMDKMVI